ncbi:hypothetical protein HZZ09_02500 [Acinetobacter nosocomialis]|nr:hypothetical protein [Acinetobacter nosocomialis]
MRSEFDTLEQYQESMKEFNENTRMGFEEFIQSHGSDRNKLQLRCTPYTSKKGGYGSFDLDFGLCVYKHQQAKVEELQRRNQMLNDNIKEQGQKLVYQNEVIETQAEKLLGLRDEKAELQKRVDQQGLIIAKAMSIASDLQKSWSMFEIGKKLEQAIKGEGK